MTRYFIARLLLDKNYQYITQNSTICLLILITVIYPNDMFMLMFNVIKNLLKSETFNPQDSRVMNKKLVHKCSTTAVCLQ